MAKITSVKIPRKWEQVKDGNFRVDIPYHSSYGFMNPDSIPESVTTISIRVGRIVLLADQKPHIPRGSCLIFEKP